MGSTKRATATGSATGINPKSVGAGDLLVEIRREDDQLGYANWLLPPEVASGFEGVVQKVSMLAGPLSLILACALLLSLIIPS